MAAREVNIGRAYAFMNCRKSKAEVAWVAKDVKSFFAGSIPLPMLDRMELRVNKGLSTIRKSPELECKEGLLEVVQRAGEEGALCLKPGTVTVANGNVLCSHDFGNLYVVRAVAVDAWNKGVANELAAIVNQMYRTHLYEEGEPFRGIIAFFENGKYALRG